MGLLFQPTTLSDTTHSCTCDHAILKHKAILLYEVGYHGKDKEYILTGREASNSASFSFIYFSPSFITFLTISIACLILFFFFQQTAPLSMGAVGEIPANAS